MDSGLTSAKLNPSPRVPNEVLDRIVHLALVEYQAKNDWERNTLEPVASFSLASRSFRIIALRRFLEDVRLVASGESLWKLLTSLEASNTGRFKSIRTLRTNSKTLSFNYAGLKSLTHLQALTIDMVYEGLSTQNSLLKLFCKYLWRPQTANFAESTYLQLTALKLTSLARIDLPLLRLLSSTMPALIHLHLSCTERIWYDCCWTCCVDSAECVIHSPIPDVFHSADELARQFSSILKTLTNLTHLHLGIFLTCESFFYEHVSHAKYEQAYPPGECDICWKSRPNSGAVIQTLLMVQSKWAMDTR